MSNNTTYNPWAGLSSYQDPETANVQLKFCGRDNESFDVAQLIDDNIFVTLYGKSGTGKTSLLNAGVFPRLRQEQYLPVSIRLGMEALDTSFQHCILSKLNQAILGRGSLSTIDVVPMPADELATECLWSYFARARFIANDGSTLFPVIVFDQFEEVFRGRREEAETLLRQIHFMMDESHALSNRVVDGQPYRYDFNFRFVVSIREDDLYRLEDSIDNCYLPDMKRCRYRLRSLSEQGARDAILIPGAGLFRDSEKDVIADAIINKSRNEDGSISTNIISLLCSRIFVDYQKSGANHISPALVDSFIKGNPFERFYNEATQGFSNREKSYIEDHLVDSTGRRNSIPESDFLLHVPKGAKLLSGDSRILQRASTSSEGGNSRIELIHDSFCEPLAVLQRRRELRKRMLWFAITFIVMLICLGVILLILSQRNTISQREKELQVANEQLMGEKNVAERKSADLSEALLQLGQAQEETERINQSLLDRNTLLEKLNIQLRQERDNVKKATDSKNKLRNKIFTDKALQLMENDSYLSALLALEVINKSGKLDIDPEMEALLRKALQKGNAKLKCSKEDILNILTPDDHHVLSISPTSMAIIDYISQDTVYFDSDKERIEYEISVVLGIKEEKPYSGLIRNKLSYAEYCGNKLLVTYIDSTICVCDCDDRGIPDTKSMTTMTHPELVSARFSRDGEHIISWSREMICIWDANTGEYQRGGGKQEGLNIQYAELDSKGEIILEINDNRVIRLIDVNSGNLFKRIMVNNDVKIMYATFSPDGNQIAAACSDNMVHIWDVNAYAGERLLIHNNTINSIEYDSYGYLLTSSSDNIVRLWDNDSTDCLLSFESPEVVRSARFSNDELSVLVKSDESIYVWNLIENNTYKDLIGHTDNIWCASYSPDGKQIASGTTKGTVLLWDAISGTLLDTIVNDSSLPISSFSFYPNEGKILVTAVTNALIYNYNSKEFHSLRNHTHGFWMAETSPDGTMFVVASTDSTIQIWDTHHSICKKVIECQIRQNYCCFNRDNKSIISAAESLPLIQIWEVHSGQKIKTFVIPNETDIFHLSVHPNGKIIAAAGRNGIYILDIDKKTQLFTIKYPSLNIDYDRNGEYLVAVCPYEIRIFETKTYTTVATYDTYRHATRVQFSPDGTQIMAAIDKEIRIWDFPSVEDIIKSAREKVKGRKLSNEEKKKYFLDY